MQPTRGLRTVFSTHKRNKTTTLVTPDTHTPPNILQCLLSQFSLYFYLLLPILTVDLLLTLHIKILIRNLYSEIRFRELNDINFILPLKPTI